MKRSLVFSVQEISDRDGLSLKERLEPDAFPMREVGAKLAGPLAVELDFSVGASLMLLSGQFEGLWEVECSRCLKPFRSSFRGRLDETYPLETPEIDAGEEIRQGMVLELPVQPLCSPACKGLCPQCGKNLNEGPCACRSEKPSPFAKLKNLERPKGP